jgi:hypothetical protein
MEGPSPHGDTGPRSYVVAMDTDGPGCTPTLFNEDEIEPDP